MIAYQPRGIERQGQEARRTEADGIETRRNIVAGGDADKMRCRRKAFASQIGEDSRRLQVERHNGGSHHDRRGEARRRPPGDIEQIEIIGVRAGAGERLTQHRLP